MGPDFLCIGAQRSGTSWLHKNLIRHPDLWLPPFQKELHYFNRRETALSLPLMKRLGWLRTAKLNRWRRHAFKAQLKSDISRLDMPKLFRDVDDFVNYRTDNLYFSIFNSTDSKVIGEITPAYATLNESSVAHIQKNIPNVKIIFAMRNPIQRAWSNAVRLLGADIHDSKIEEERFFKYFNLDSVRLRGDYLRTLGIWKKYFPEENFFVYFFEEIENPEALLHQICDFLDVQVTDDFVENIDRNKIYSFAHQYSGEMPPNIGNHLAKMYYSEINQLSNCFGSHAKSWLRYAETLLSDTL